MKRALAAKIESECRTPIRVVNHSARCHQPCIVSAPGCTVHVTAGLRSDGRPMTLISITADGDAYDGPRWWIEGEEGEADIGFRIIQVSDA